MTTPETRYAAESFVPKQVRRTQDKMSLRENDLRLRSQNGVGARDPWGQACRETKQTVVNTKRSVDAKPEGD